MNISPRISTTCAIAMLSGLLSTTLVAQSLAWSFLQRPNSPDPKMICITVDPAGNLYTGGQSGPTDDMDPGPGVVLLGGPSSSAFVRKMDTNGIYQWSVAFEEVGFSSVCRPEEICIDALGNIIVAGQFSHTVDFDPSAAQALRTATTGSDCFVCKLDASGNFLWVDVLANGQYAWPSRLSTDPANNIWVGGILQFAADFDPGPADQTLTPNGSAAGYLWKLDPDGNYLWAGLIDGDGSQDAIVTDVATNATGDLFASGWHSGTVDLDPGANMHIDSGPTPREFVLKLLPSGDLYWAACVKGQEPIGLAVDGEGNVLATGALYHIWGAYDFNPGPGEYNLNTDSRVPFVWKLSGQGDLIWAEQLGDTGSVAEPVGVATDGANNVIITGRAYWGVDLDPGPGSVPPPATPANNFISVLDAQGNFIWGGHITHDDWEIDLSNSWSWAPVTDAAGSIYVAGLAWGTIDLDPGPGNVTLVANELNDGNQWPSSFVVKLNGVSTGITRTDDPAFSVYPVPVQNVLHLATNEPVLRASLLDMSGRLVRLFHPSARTLDVHDLPAGSYVLDVVTAYGRSARKVVKD